jgi:hypothetical protein
MGGTFATFMALHHPDLVAASFVYVPKLLFKYTPDPSPAIRSSLDRMWGQIPTDLPVLGTGTSVGVWMDGRDQLRAQRVSGPAPMMGFVGRNDVVVGWPEKLPFLAAADSALAGGYWFWDTRTHDASRTAPWSPMQDTRYLGRFRRDRSWPALSHCSANSDPGDGTPASGDTLGQINAFVEWDTTLTDQPTYWQLTLRLRDLQSRSGITPAPESLTVDVTPRRLRRFLPVANTPYVFSVRRASTGRGAQLGTALADAQGVVTLHGVKVYKTGSIVTLQTPGFDAVPVAAAPGSLRLSVSHQPLAGDGILEVHWGPGAPGTVELFDISGRRQALERSAGSDAITRLRLPAGSLEPGLWFARARQGERSATSRIVVVR